MSLGLLHDRIRNDLRTRILGGMLRPRSGSSITSTTTRTAAPLPVRADVGVSHGCSRKHRHRTDPAPGLLCAFELRRRAADKRAAPFVSNIDLYARILEGSRTALGTLPDGVLGAAPHSLRAVKPDQLGALIDLWRPVAWLLDNAPVDGRWCLIHATHMDSHEVTSMARTGAVAACVPSRKPISATVSFAAPISCATAADTVSARTRTF